MERNRRPARLARAGQLLELGSARLDVLTAGADHPRVDEAHEWLRSARSQVVRAAGLGRDSRALLNVVSAGVAIWILAVLFGDLLGLPGSWTAAITLLVVLLGLAFPLSRLLTVFDRWLGRRRLARARPAPPVTPPPGVGRAGETLALLRLARRELTVLMRERSAGHPTAGAFDRLWAATRALGLPPSLNRRPEKWAIVTTSLMVVLSTTTLLLVPHPTRPWVLADLRDGLAAIGAALEPADRETDLKAGRCLELAHIWLDDAEIGAGQRRDQAR